LDQYRTFIIHLPRALGRQAQVAHLSEAAPYGAEVLDAVEGAALSDEEREEAYSGTKIHRPKYPFALNAGEIGCFLSHRAAWQKIVDEGLDAALILEDDVQIEDEVFANSLTLAEAHIENFGYIQFQVRPIKGAFRVLAEDGGRKLVTPTITPLRTSAQLVSAKAAAHLLQITARFDRPIDTFLQMHWITGIPLACALPSGVSDRTAQTGGSSISKKLPLQQKMRREIQRALYRRAVRIASTR
jgi:glycosyl transferase family 25